MNDQPDHADGEDEASRLDRLHDLARDFAVEVDELLRATVDPDATVVVERQREHYLVTARPPAVLRISGAPRAELRVEVQCCWDSAATFLAVRKSTLKLVHTARREPLIRVEYEREAHSKPSAHLQVHAESGVLTHLLALGGHPTPHAVASLHLPMGGERFRPCLEDFVEFLVGDCRFDGLDGWRDAVQDGRERWRRRQVRSVVRDAPSEAQAALEALGYQVTPPRTGPAPDNVARLRRY